MALRVNMIPGTLSTMLWRRIPPKQRPVALLIDGVAFGMVEGSEYPLDPEGVQQLGPYFAHKFTSTVREEPALRAEVLNHMPKEGLTLRVCGVIARRDKDGVPRIAANKHDEELLAVIGWQRPHNVDR